MCRLRKSSRSSSRFLRAGVGKVWLRVRLAANNASPSQKDWFLRVKSSDFSAFVHLRKPVVSRTFNSLPARRSGSPGVVLLLAFVFRGTFLRHCPGYSSVCLKDWRVGAELTFSHVWIISIVFLTATRSLILYPQRDIAKNPWSLAKLPTG